MEVGALKQQIEILPNEILFEIFSNLRIKDLIQLSYVCKRFNSLALHLKLWQGYFHEIPQSLHSPSRRLSHTLVVYKNKLYLYGGNQPYWENNDWRNSRIIEITSQFFEYNLETKKWTELQTELPLRTGHISVIYENKMWFTGGVAQGYHSDMVSLDLETFQIEEFSSPYGPRSGHTLEVAQNKMYMFGGWQGRLRDWYNDVWEYDPSNNIWRTLNCTGQIPLPRCSHLSAIYGDYMYIFGGYDGKIYYNDLFRLNLKTKVWECIWPQKTAPIPPRSRATVVRYKHYMYILSGWDRVGYFSDFWRYDFQKNIWEEVQSRWGIPPRSQHAALVHGDFMYVWGGFDSHTFTTSSTFYKYRFRVETETLPVDRKFPTHFIPPNEKPYSN